jgi:hypothetical protein
MNTTPTTNNPAAQHASQIDQTREHLLATLAALRDRDNPMPADQARAIASVAGVLVDSARVEVEFLKVTGKDHSPLFDRNDATRPALTHIDAPANGIRSITRHHLVG